MKTSRGSFLGAFGLSALVLALGVSNASGQGFKEIHVCGGSDGQPNGLIQNPADGFFYGTSYGGNGYGTVFKMDTSGNVTTIHSFAGPPGDGRYPQAGLFLNSDGLLYGTTYLGGANDVGTVFHIDTSGGTYAFTSQPGAACGAVGSSPYSSLIKASDGKLYVTMNICGPGSNPEGTIDQVSTTLGESEVAYFDFNTDEFNYPYGCLVEGTDNNLYGTAWLNTHVDPNSHGGIYRIPLGGGSIEVVHNFAPGEGVYGHDASLSGE